MFNVKDNAWKVFVFFYERPAFLIFLLVSPAALYVILRLTQPSQNNSISSQDVAASTSKNAALRFFSLKGAPAPARLDKSSICAKQKYSNESFQYDAIVSHMDLSVDPCTDFYEYACGCFPFNNPLSDNESCKDFFSLIRERNEMAIKYLLEQPTAKSQAEKSAQRYYRSCTAFNGYSNNLVKKAFLNFLNQTGGWPIVGRGKSRLDDNLWDFQEMMQTTNNALHVNSLFTWNVSPINIENSTRFFIQIGLIGQGSKLTSSLGMLLSRYYDVNEIINENNLPTIVVDLLGEMMRTSFVGRMNFDWNQITNDDDGLIALATELAQMKKEEECEQIIYTIPELQALAPFLHWDQFFQSVFMPFPQVNVTRSTLSIVVNCPTYLHTFSKIIEALLATDKGRIILIMQVAKEIINTYLPKLLQWNEKEKVSCVDDTNDVMNFAVSAMFVRQKFNGGSKELVQAMVMAIKKSFKNNLNNLGWLDDETRQAAKDKADAIIDLMGYPDFAFDTKQLDKYFSDFQVESNYLTNKLRYFQFSRRKQMDQLNQLTIEPESWWIDNTGMQPMAVNAYYRSTFNQIILSVGIMQPPFFDVTFPPAFNFGALGFSIGHELTHGFDTSGRKYDPRGNIVSWWNNATTERFEKRAECFVEQYAGYSINGQQLDGIGTIAENIADNGGLRAAFFAFNNWTANNPMTHADSQREFSMLLQRNMT